MEDETARAIRELEHTNWYVRRRAAEALGVRGDAGAIPPLIRALTDDDRQLRMVAARALARISGQHATPELLPALALLRQQLRFWYWEQPGSQEAETLQEAIRQIEQATAAISVLPVPAPFGTPPARDLPMPAGAPSPVVLPAGGTPVERWGRKLGRWRRAGPGR